MGFGFKVENNDFSLNGIGEIEKVYGEEKLERDLIKILITSKKGEYGSDLAKEIGSKIKGTHSIIMEIRRKVSETIERLVKIQETDDTITDSEIISQANVYVYPSMESPDTIEFTVDILTLDGEKKLSKTFTVEVS